MTESLFQGCSDPAPLDLEAWDHLLLDYRWRQRRYNAVSCALTILLTIYLNNLMIISIQTITSSSLTLSRLQNLTVRSWTEGLVSEIKLFKDSSGGLLLNPNNVTLLNVCVVIRMCRSSFCTPTCPWVI